MAAAKPAPLSPAAQASVKIGAATITIDYARPSMRGRKIMGTRQAVGGARTAIVPQVASVSPGSG